MLRWILFFLSLATPALAQYLTVNAPSSVTSGNTYSVDATPDGWLNNPQTILYKNGSWVDSEYGDARWSGADTGTQTVTFSADGNDADGNYFSGSANVSIELGSMTPPTSSNASVTYGGSFDAGPSISAPTSNGTGGLLWCVAGYTNYGTGAWTPPGAGSYTFFVGQKADSNHQGNVNDPNQGPMEVGNAYTLTVNKAPMNPPTSSSATVDGLGAWAPNITAGANSGNGATIWCVAGYTNYGTGAWAPPGPGTYTFYVAQKGDANHTGNTNDPNQGDIEVNYTAYTLKVNGYSLTVNGGSGSGTFASGTVVSVSGSVPAGYGFNSWVLASGPGSIGNTNSVNTTFTMGAGNAVVNEYVYVLPPSNLQSSNVGMDHFTVTWNTTPGFTYLVSTGGAYTQVSGGSCPFNGAMPGTTYGIYVEAMDSGGNRSADSFISVTTAPDTQPPSTPTGLQVTGQASTNITVAWNASTDNVAVAGYYVRVDGSSSMTYATTGTSYTVSGLGPNQNHSIAVEAIDTAGNASGWSGSVSATTLADTQPPSVPARLRAGSVSVTCLTLAWDPSSDDVGTTAYEVFQNGVSLGTTATTSFNIGNLTAVTSYSFTVRARDAAGNWSAQCAPLAVGTNAPVLVGIHAAGYGTLGSQTFTVTSYEGSQPQASSATGAGASAWTPIHQYRGFATGVDNTVKVSGPSYQREVRFEAPSGYSIFINGIAYTNTATISLANANGGSADSSTITFDIVPSDGTAALQAGYAIDPQISIDDVIWSLALGRTPDGRSLGALSLRKTNVTGAAFSTDALELTGSDIPNAVEIYGDGSFGGPWNAYRRFIQSVGNCWVWLDDHVSGQPQSYCEIKVYDPASNPQWDGNRGTYKFMNGGIEVQPFAHYAVSSNAPTNDTFTFTKSKGSAQELSWTLNKSVSGSTTTWLLKKAGQHSLRTVSTVSGNTTTDAVTLEDGAGNVVQTYQRVYQLYPWGKKELVSETDDPSGSNLVTSYTYGTSGPSYGKRLSVTKPDGTYVAYDYCTDDAAYGNLWHTYTPWLDVASTAATAGSSNANTVTLTYKPVHDFFADALDTTTTTVPGTSGAVTVAKTARNPDFTSTTFNGKKVRKETIQTYTGSSTYLTTTRLSYHPDETASDSANRLISETEANGTKTSAAYYQGSFTDAGDSNSTIFKQTGNPAVDTQWGEYVFNGFSTQVTNSQLVNTWDSQPIDPIYLVPNRSTIQLTVVVNGQPKYKVNYVFTGASGGVPTFEFLGRESFTVTTSVDANGNATTTKTHTTHAGEQTQQVFTNGQLTSETNNGGTVINYTYDASGLLLRKDTTGVAASGNYAAQGTIYAHYTYDAASRKISEKSSNSMNPLDPGPTATIHYDSAGRIDSQTDAAGLVTGIAYNLSSHTTTTTLPGGATKIVTTYADGSAKSITGTAVVGEYHTTTVNSDGTITRIAYALRSSDVSSPTTAPRWAKSTTDWAGRVIREESPAIGGSVAKVYTYNAKGELTRLQTVDGSSGTTLTADTYTDYNAYEMPYRTGQDLDGTADLQTGSASDRIVETDSYYAKDSNNVWWLTQTTQVYNQSSNSAGVITGTTKVRQNQFAAAGTNVNSETVTIDLYGNQTDTKITVDRTNKLVTTTTVDPDSTTPAVSITRNGLLVSSQSKEGLIVTYAYDSLGRLICSSDPRIDGATLAKDLGARVGYYDGTAAVGSRYQKSWTKDPAGYQTSYSYSNSTGRLTSVQQPPLVNQAGKYTYYDYTLRGESYRTWGNVPYPVQYGFNDYGEKVSMTTYRGGDSSTWTTATWPATPPAGDQTTWTFDPATGLLLNKTDAAGKQVTYQYNKLGQMTTRTWARGVVETYKYFGDDSGDPMTRELKSVDYSDTPNTNPDVSYTYNRFGATATVTDATGVRTIAYNPTTMAIQNETLSSFFGGRIITPKYDTTGTGTKGRGIGFSLGVSGNVTSDYDVTYGFDASGRPGSVTSGGASFVYGYQPGSNLIASVSDSVSGWTQTRTWMANRDLLSKIETKISTTSKASFTYGVDEWGRRTSLIRSGEVYSRYINQGLVTTWGYDDRSQVTGSQTYFGQSLTDLSYPVEGRNHSFSFDNIGNRLTSSVDGRQTTYNHNNLNQITDRVTPNSVDVSGFAPSGSTVQVNGQAVTRQGDYYHTALTVDNSTTAVNTNVSVTSTSPSATTTRKAFLAKNTLTSAQQWQYDLDGNITQDDQWTYGWDAENRLTSMQTRADLLTAGVFAAADARRLEFTYDYMNRRSEKIVRSGWNGTSYTAVLSDTRFIYGKWNLIGEYDVLASNALVRSYTWGVDLSGTMGGAAGVGGLLMAQQGSTQYLYAFDGNGNVSAVMNRSGGTTVAEYEYGAFGEAIRASNTFAQTNPFRFSTKYTDNETGMIYYGYRYYSPSIGRFLGRDPSGEKGGIHLYRFVNNNPVNAWDYLGMDPQDQTVAREPDQESPPVKVNKPNAKPAQVDPPPPPDDDGYGGDFGDNSDPFADINAMSAQMDAAEAEHQAENQAVLNSVVANLNASVDATMSGVSDSNLDATASYADSLVSASTDANIQAYSASASSAMTADANTIYGNLGGTTQSDIAATCSNITSSTGGVAIGTFSDSTAGTPDTSVQQPTASSLTVSSKNGTSAPVTASQPTISDHAAGVLQGMSDAVYSQARGILTIASVENPLMQLYSPLVDLAQSKSQTTLNAVFDFTGTHPTAEGKVGGAVFANITIGLITMGEGAASEGGSLLLRDIGEDAATVKPGSFSIIDWTGYPESLPKPDGPFRLLQGAEYDAARAQANTANRALHAADESLGGWQLHEIQPVKFNGSPTDISNKMPLPTDAHAEVTNWWRALQQYLEHPNPGS